MAITRALLLTRVKERIAADQATPAINDLHDNSIYSWAAQHINDVIEMLPQPALRFPDLIENDTAITISAGEATLPTDHKIPLSCIAQSVYTDKNGDSVTVTERRCRILRNPDDFKRYDSVNFVLTPDNRRPVVLITDKAYFKPTSNLSSAKLTYIKQHPALSVSQGTLFDEMGDNLLVLLIVQRYYKFLEDFDLATTVANEISGVLSYANPKVAG